MVKRSEELAAQVEALVYRMKISERSQCDTVSLQELHVIGYLAGRPGARMTEIADYLLIGWSNLTAIVDRLVAKKLVERARSEEDRRVVLATLTAGGKAIAQASRAQKRRLAEQMLAPLSDADQEKLLAIMRKIVGELSAGRGGSG